MNKWIRLITLNWQQKVCVLGLFLVVGNHSIMAAEYYIDEIYNADQISRGQVEGYTSGLIDDDQMTNWLKAVFDNGMNYDETLNYTSTMLNSGITLDFSHLSGFVIDKHSTGGVGDKVSIVLAPLLAACDCYIPMLAGRGLGHTQGTIDKLEAIPGYRSLLSLSEFKKIVEECGILIEDCFYEHHNWIIIGHA